MNDADSERQYRTLQGALSGEEANEPRYFSYSATLRVFGMIPDLDDLTGQLGIKPTHSHHRGDRRQPTAEPNKHDMWLYRAPVDKEEPLHVHIDALWSCFKEKKGYLLQIKENVTVDVFLGYRSNCDHAGVEVPHKSLEMFMELQIPFGLSIIVT